MILAIRMAAIGFAKPLPAMSRAEPHIKIKSHLNGEEKPVESDVVGNTRLKGI
jgi:hypothetical protein